MNYSLNIGVWNNVFAVPACVVDNYIKLAGGSSLKLLLYLLRHGGEEISDERIKRELGFTEFGELEDAAVFWVQRGLIKADHDDAGKLTPKAEPINAAADQPRYEQITLEETPKTPEITPNDSAPQKKSASLKRVQYSSKEIADRINSDPKIKFLFEEAEKLYGHQLRQSENIVIIGLTDNYGLPVEVALMLLKYCFKIKKGTPAYISKVAENWMDDSIDTIEAANVRIRELERSHDVEERLREAMEMTTKLSLKMKQFIRIWTKDWSFDEDMIMLAYDRTVDHCGKWDIKYANGILERWHNNGIKDLKSAEREDKEFHEKLSEQYSKNKSYPKAPVTEMSDNSESSFDTDEVLNRIISQYN